MTDLAWDPRTVPVAFFTDAGQARSALNGTLRDATAVAVDTETVILRDAAGNIIKRDMDVDGPGPWRVMSIAAKFDTDEGVRYQAWVIDMENISASIFADAFQGVTPWGWNANFDRGVLGRGGLKVRRWNDAMLYDAVLKQGAYCGVGERPFYTSLADAVVRHLGLPGIVGKEDTRMNYDEHTPLTPEEIQYAADDAITTLFVGEVLTDRAQSAGLLQVCQRTSAAQPFIQSMKINGLPFAAETYQAVVDNATQKANAASERLAVLTTGQELLRTLCLWATSSGVLADPMPPCVTDDPNSAEAQLYVVETGLPLLHDTATFAQFIAAVREQAAAAQDKIAAVLGLDAQEDMFSEGVIYSGPFKIDDETTIRRWLNKTAPQFVAEYLAAVGGTSRGLVKAHDLLDVYRQISAQPADVTPELAQVAAHLEAYTRYKEILAQYGQVDDGAVTLRPDWNVSSADQVKENLNRFSQANVLAFAQKYLGSPRLLEKSDSIDSMALKFIGGPICEALLEFREHDKMVTTYGDELIKAVHPVTGRVHASYTQELTGTARLASFSPNAQNLSPLAKPHMRVVEKAEDGSLVSRDPQGRLRVLVAVDLSQAELRFIADMAQDENMLAAFRSGEDLHTRTGTLMFSVDLKALKANGDKPLSALATFVQGVGAYATATPSMLAEDLYKQLRSKAKAVAFGYAYGLKGASLANQLTANGVETTKAEADELLAQFDIAYPQVAAWMAVRVKFIQDIVDALKDQDHPSGVDFESSWRLHKLFFRARSASNALKTKNGYKPTPRETAEHLVSDEDLRARLGSDDPAQDVGPEWDAQWEEQRELQASKVAWALGHYGSAILAEDGTPWSFESRNVTNRRRLFQIGTADWTMSMVALVARSRRKFAMDLTDAWVAAYNAEQDADMAARVAAGKAPGKAKYIALRKVDPRTKRSTTLTAKELEQALPSKELRISFVDFVLESYKSLAAPEAARDYLFRHAMADCVRKAGNQYRNHPIQSGVADAVLEAFARIDTELLERFPTAQGIQSVHDSIVIECDLEHARAVREIVVRHMETALAELCPTVPCVADGDVQLSLDGKSSLSEEELDALLTRYALAA